MCQLPQSVLIYDGYCSFCGSLAARMRAWDRQGRTTFLSSASPEAEPFLAGPAVGVDPAATVILVRGEDVLVRSDAVLVWLLDLGGLRGFLARLARPIPRSWRDRVYDLVARNRHRLPTCPLPEESPGSDR